MGSEANVKIRIILAYSQGTTFEELADREGISAAGHCPRVTAKRLKEIIEEYENDGTMTVNSKLNRL